MNRLSQVVIRDKFPTSIGKTVGISTIINNSLEAAIAIAGIMMLFLFVFGGISIIAGAGQNNPESVARGKKALTAALIGFIIILTSFWIVRIIEIIIGYDFISEPPDPALI